MTRARPLARAKSEAWWQRGNRVIPAGTQTFSKGPNQFVNGVAPKYLCAGKGSHVRDVDGNEYIDFGMALGPVILGYGYPAVNQAIAEQLERGITFTLMHPLEVELAERLVELVPCAEMVRFGKNGSDATAGAIRVARAFTRRERVAWCGYHGWQDWYIGSTSRHLGVPKAVCGLASPFNYNDLGSLDSLLGKHPGEFAAVILEPTNFIEPAPGFLEGVRDIAHRHGALLIFDEVITGFRMALGGAQQYFGVTPDLAAFGKAMGNGMPISALVGRAEVMRLFDEVFFSFTFGGEALSLAAALATLRELESRNVLKHIWAMGQELIVGYRRLVREEGLEDVTRCIGYPCWPDLVFEEDGKPSTRVQTLFLQEIVKRGVLTRPGMFICFSHTSEDIRRTLEAFREALRVIKGALASGRFEDALEGDIVEPVIRATT